MALLSPEEMNESFGVSSITLEPSQKAKVIITSYEPFFYGENKDKKMPKYLAVNAETNAPLEFVGFKFHEEVKAFNDQINPTVTVLDVECVDNGTKYFDYKIEIADGSPVKAAEANPFE